MKTKTLLIRGSLLLVAALTLLACQSSGSVPIDPEQAIEFKGIGYAYYQNGEHLNYETVRLALLRNPRSRSYQAAVNKWENNVLLQVLSGIVWPALPFYVGQDTALRKESVEAYNESQRVGDTVITVESWEEAGFITEVPQ